MSRGEKMKVSELIEKLKEFEPDSEVEIGSTVADNPYTVGIADIGKLDDMVVIYF